MTDKRTNQYINKAFNSLVNSPIAYQNALNVVSTIKDDGYGAGASLMFVAENNASLLNITEESLRTDEGRQKALAKAYLYTQASNAMDAANRAYAQTSDRKAAKEAFTGVLLDPSSGLYGVDAPDTDAARIAYRNSAVVHKDGTISSRYYDTYSGNMYDASNPLVEGADVGSPFGAWMARAFGDTMIGSGALRAYNAFDQGSVTALFEAPTRFAAMKYNIEQGDSKDKMIGDTSAAIATGVGFGAVIAETYFGGYMLRGAGTIANLATKGGVIKALAMPTMFAAKDALQSNQYTVLNEDNLGSKMLSTFAQSFAGYALGDMLGFAILKNTGWEKSIANAAAKATLESENVKAATNLIKLVKVHPAISAVTNVVVDQIGDIGASFLISRAAGFEGTKSYEDYITGLYGGLGNDNVTTMDSVKSIFTNTAMKLAGMAGSSALRLLGSADTNKNAFGSRAWYSDLAESNPILKQELMNKSENDLNISTKLSSFTYHLFAGSLDNVDIMVKTSPGMESPGGLVDYIKKLGPNGITASLYSRLAYANEASSSIGAALYGINGNYRDFVAALKDLNSGEIAGTQTDSQGNKYDNALLAMLGVANSVDNLRLSDEASDIKSFRTILDNNIKVFNNNSSTQDQKDLAVRNIKAIASIVDEYSLYPDKDNQAAQSNASYANAIGGALKAIGVKSNDPISVSKEDKLSALKSMAGILIADGLDVDTKKAVEAISGNKDIAKAIKRLRKSGLIPPNTQSADPVSIDDVYTAVGIPKAVVEHIINNAADELVKGKFTADNIEKAFAMFDDFHSAIEKIANRQADDIERILTSKLGNKELSIAIANKYSYLTSLVSISGHRFNDSTRQRLNSILEIVGKSENPIIIRMRDAISNYHVQWDSMVSKKISLQNRLAVLKLANLNALRSISGVLDRFEMQDADHLDPEVMEKLYHAFNATNLDPYARESIIEFIENGESKSISIEDGDFDDVIGKTLAITLNVNSGTRPIVVDDERSFKALIGIYVNKLISKVVSSNRIVVGSSGKIDYEKLTEEVNKAIKNILPETEVDGEYIKVNISKSGDQSHVSISTSKSLISTEERARFVASVSNLLKSSVVKLENLNPSVLGHTLLARPSTIVDFLVESDPAGIHGVVSLKGSPMPREAFIDDVEKDIGSFYEVAYKALCVSDSIADARTYFYNYMKASFYSTSIVKKLNDSSADERNSAIDVMFRYALTRQNVSDAITIRGISGGDSTSFFLAAKVLQRSSTSLIFNSEHLSAVAVSIDIDDAEKKNRTIQALNACGYYELFHQGSQSAKQLFFNFNFTDKSTTQEKNFAITQGIKDILLKTVMTSNPNMDTVAKVLAIPDAEDTFSSRAIKEMFDAHGRFLLNDNDSEKTVLDKIAQVFWKVKDDQIKVLEDNVSNIAKQPSNTGSAQSYKVSDSISGLDAFAGGIKSLPSFKKLHDLNQKLSDYIKDPGSSNLSQTESEVLSKISGALFNVESTLLDAINSGKSQNVFLSLGIMKNVVDLYAKANFVFKDIDSVMREHIDTVRDLIGTISSQKNINPYAVKFNSLLETEGKLNTIKFYADDLRKFIAEGNGNASDYAKVRLGFSDSDAFTFEYLMNDIAPHTDSIKNKVGQAKSGLIKYIESARKSNLKFIERFSTKDDMKSQLKEIMLMTMSDGHYSEMLSYKEIAKRVSALGVGPSISPVILDRAVGLVVDKIRTSNPSGDFCVAVFSTDKSSTTQYDGVSFNKRWFNEIIAQFLTGSTDSSSKQTLRIDGSLIKQVAQDIEDRPDFADKLIDFAIHDANIKILGDQFFIRHFLTSSNVKTNPGFGMNSSYTYRVFNVNDQEGQDFIRRYIYSTYLHQEIQQKAMETSVPEQVSISPWSAVALAEYKTDSIRMQKIRDGISEDIIEEGIDGKEILNKVASKIRQQKNSLVGTYSIIGSTNNKDISERVRVGNSKDMLANVRPSGLFDPTGTVNPNTLFGHDATFEGYASTDLFTIAKETYLFLKKGKYSGEEADKAKAAMEKVLSAVQSQQHIIGDDIESTANDMLSFLSSQGNYAKLQEPNSKSFVYFKIYNRTSNDGVLHYWPVPIAEIRGTKTTPGVMLNNYAAKWNLADYDGDTLTALPVSNEAISAVVHGYIRSMNISKSTKEAVNQNMLLSLAMVTKHMSDTEMANSNFSLTLKSPDVAGEFDGLNEIPAKIGGTMMKMTQMVNSAFTNLIGDAEPGDLVYEVNFSPTDILHDNRMEFRPVPLHIKCPVLGHFNTTKHVFFSLGNKGMFSGNFHGSKNITYSMQVGSKDMNDNTPGLRVSVFGNPDNDTHTIVVTSNDERNLGASVHALKNITCTASEAIAEVRRIADEINTATAANGSSFVEIESVISQSKMFDTYNKIKDGSLRILSPIEAFKQFSNAFTNQPTTAFWKSIFKDYNYSEEQMLSLSGDIKSFLIKLYAATALDVDIIGYRENGTIYIKTAEHANIVSTISRSANASRLEPVNTSEIGNVAKQLLIDQLGLTTKDLPDTKAISDDSKDVSEAYHSLKNAVMNDVISKIETELKHLKTIEDLFNGYEKAPVSSDIEAAYDHFLNKENKTPNAEAFVMIMSQFRTKDKGFSKLPPAIIDMMSEEAINEFNSMDKTTIPFFGKEAEPFLTKMSFVRKIANIIGSTSDRLISMQRLLSISDAYNKPILIKGIGPDLSRASAEDTLAEFIVNKIGSVNTSQYNPISKSVVKTLLQRIGVSLEPSVLEKKVAGLSPEHKSAMPVLNHEHNVSDEKLFLNMVSGGASRTLYIKGSPVTVEDLADVFIKEMKLAEVGNAKLIQNVFSVLTDNTDSDTKSALMLSSIGVRQDVFNKFTNAFNVNGEYSTTKSFKLKNLSLLESFNPPPIGSNKKLLLDSYLKPYITGNIDSDNKSNC